MGLIKAAIIVGGGAYAIKQLSKRREEKRQNRMRFDQNMSQQYYDDENNSNNKRGLDGGDDYHYYDYPVEKGNRSYNEKQVYNGSGGGCRRQQQQQQQQRTPSPVHPYALEFVDRRSPDQQQSQTLRLNNTYNQPVPQSNGFNNEYYQGPPPQYHQQTTRGFVEPDELSTTSENPTSSWDRKARRGESGGNGGQAFLNTLAQQASGVGGDRKGSSSPKEYLESHLSR